MIAKVSYLGFFPLGDEVMLRNTKIMQEEWNSCTFPVWVIGKKHIVNPIYGEVYYVVNESQTVFFVATECGVGHYHIFTFSEKVQKKLRNRIKVY